MKLNEEIKQISQKDLTNLNGEELKNYSVQLMNLTTSADANANKWKKIYQIVGGIISLVATLLIVCAIFSYRRTFNTTVMTICYVFAGILLMSTYVLKFFYKKATSDSEKMKRIYSLKLVEINNQIANNATKNSNNAVNNSNNETVSETPAENK